MAINNAINQKFTNSSDGFIIGGGNTQRNLTVTAGDITLTGGNAFTYTLPSASSTLASLGLTETFTGLKTFSAGIVGSATNDSASAGNMGEYISSNIAIGSAVSATTATTLNITSISLTAGDWDVRGNVGFISAAGTLPTILIGSISQTSATLPTAPNGGAYAREEISFPAAGTQIFPTGTLRISLASTTTIYLVAQATFTVSTLTAYGFIGARRAR